MISFEIPGRGNFQITNLVLDVNGTIAVNGNLIKGVTERLQELTKYLNIHILTANTHGKQHLIDKELNLSSHIIPAGREAEMKAEFVEKINAQSVVAMGNGSNDALMLKKASIGIAVLGEEGLSIDALVNADIIVNTPLEGLDLLLNKNRLIATLRK